MSRHGGGFDHVERTVTEELNVRISKAFSRFDRTPLAAASLGQVHRAALRDGREVAVKIQRPVVREHVLRDMGTMEEVAEFLDRHTEAGRRVGLTRMVSELRASLLRELDYPHAVFDNAPLVCRIAGKLGAPADVGLKLTEVWLPGIAVLVRALKMVELMMRP